MPACLVLAGDDATDDVRESLAQSLALQRVNVPVELHLYARGGQEFGMRETNPITSWLALAETRMRNLGMLPAEHRWVRAGIRASVAAATNSCDVRSTCRRQDRLSDWRRRRYRLVMTKSTTTICFETKLLRPATPADATWTFLVLPASASAKLPTRSMTTVDGMLGGQPFQATLEPDGQGSHWLKVDKALREIARVDVGDTVALEITPVDKEPEPEVPADLREALAANAGAQATWLDITPVARRDWIAWVTSGKKAETRTKRIDTACDKLASGMRRVCCFDRSGMYSKGNMGAPQAAE